MSAVTVTAGAGKSRTSSAATPAADRRRIRTAFAFLAPSLVGVVAVPGHPGHRALRVQPPELEPAQPGHRGRIQQLPQHLPVRRLGALAARDLLLRPAQHPAPDGPGPGPGPAAEQQAPRHGHLPGAVRAPVPVHAGGDARGLELGVRPELDGSQPAAVATSGSRAGLAVLASYAMPVVAFANIWQYAGYNMLFFLAGLQAIPPDAVRGGRHRRRRAGLGSSSGSACRCSTRPCCSSWSPASSARSRSSTPPYVLTQGGPGNATDVLNLTIYHIAFQRLPARRGLGHVGSLVRGDPLVHHRSSSRSSEPEHDYETGVRSPPWPRSHRRSPRPPQSRYAQQHEVRARPRSAAHRPLPGPAAIALVFMAPYMFSVFAAFKPTRRDLHPAPARPPPSRCTWANFRTTSCPGDFLRYLANTALVTVALTAGPGRCSRCWAPTPSPG